jgi:hypothetical protein
MDKAVVEDDAVVAITLAVGVVMVVLPVVEVWVDDLTIEKAEIDTGDITAPR